MARLTSGSTRRVLRDEFGISCHQRASRRLYNLSVRQYGGYDGNEEEVVSAHYRRRSLFSISCRNRPPRRHFTVNLHSTGRTGWTAIAFQFPEAHANDPSRSRALVGLPDPTRCDTVGCATTDLGRIGSWLAAFGGAIAIPPVRTRRCITPSSAGLTIGSWSVPSAEGAFSR